MMQIYVGPKSLTLEVGDIIRYPGWWAIVRSQLDDRTVIVDATGPPRWDPEVSPKAVYCGPVMRRLWSVVFACFGLRQKLRLICDDDYPLMRLDTKEVLEQ